MSALAEKTAAPRKLAAAGPFTVRHFRAWAKDLILDNGKPWKLEPFQLDVVKDLFAGFTEVWMIVPEGNGKTTLTAGLALYHCEFTEMAEVPVAASSRDQAEILYRQAAGLIRRSPKMEAKFRPYDGYRRIVCHQSGGRIQVFAADDRTGDGVIFTLGILDELHRHRDLKLYRTWGGKTDKRDGQMMVISTAGEPGAEFEEVRERKRQESADVTRDGCHIRAADEDEVLHEWAIPEDADVKDLEAVKSANPFSGITVETLGKKWRRKGMTEGHWRRFTCNLPTRSEMAAIQEAEWFSAVTKEEIPAGEPIWLGLDVAWKWDTTAAVPLWWKSDEYRLFGPASVVVPPRDGNSLDPALVERALIEIHQKNPLHTVVMDVSRAEQLGSWIESELGAVVVDRSQSNVFAAVDYEKFMDALRNGWLKHSGDHDLTAHALNAIARILPYGDARFERPSQSRAAREQDRRVIDALTAAAMVHSAAALQPGGDFLVDVSEFDEAA